VVQIQTIRQLIRTIRTGREVDSAAAASRRIEALQADGQGAVVERYVAEKQAEREARQDRAAKRAVRVIDEAVAADEADAGAGAESNT
jgi:hypothetical protein